MGDGGMADIDVSREFDRQGSAGLQFLENRAPSIKRVGGPENSGLGAPVIPPTAGVPDTGGNKKGEDLVSPPDEEPEPQKEKKDALKRKARKRSLLGEEDTKVYRRSILGS